MKDIYSQIQIITYIYRVKYNMYIVRARQPFISIMIHMYLLGEMLKNAKFKLICWASIHILGYTFKVAEYAEVGA